MTEQQIELVVAAQNGDVKSFEQLFAAFYDKVYGFARMILKNETDAEDVLQETFITAWRKLDSLENPAAFSVWIQIIAKNLSNMQLRRKNIAVPLEEEQDIESFDIEDTDDFLPAIYAEREDLRERLGKIIDGLSGVQRQAIVLYYFNGSSVEEIANIMECSPGTVKSRLYLARNAIKAEVKENESKTGQKFYGIAGIPMLPFGNLIQSHVESLSIGREMADAFLQVITNSILNSSGAAAATTATILPFATKTVAAIISVAAVAAVVVVATLTNSSIDTATIDGDDLIPAGAPDHEVVAEVDIPEIEDVDEQESTTETEPEEEDEIVLQGDKPEEGNTSANDNFAPQISGGQASLSLTAGYGATSTSAFSITGHPAPSITQDTTHGGRITWNNALHRLDIAAGLTEGNYPVVLTASNTAGKATFTFTLTVAGGSSGGGGTPPATAHNIANYYNADGTFSDLGLALPLNSGGERILTVHQDEIVIVGANQYRVLAGTLILSFYTQPSIDSVIVWWTDYMNSWQTSGTVIGI